MENFAFRRRIYAVVGVMLVGLAAVGAMLPGIPTVGPLLLASYFLMKSSPALEKRMIRNRFFGKYVRYLDGTSQWTTRMRLSSIAMMWVSISLSGAVIYFFGSGQTWLLITLGLAGLIGTVFILRFRRETGNHDA